MHETLSFIVGAGLFVLYWDLWNVQEPEDDDRGER